MIKFLYASIAALFLLTAGYSYSQAAEKITLSPGGNIIEFVEKYNSVRESEGKLILDGTCISACTLFLGLVPEDKVCATPFGLLGFHSASVYNRMTGERAHSSVGTRLIWNYYPKRVQDALKSKGWDVNNPHAPQLEEHHDIIYFPATDFVRPCNAAS